MDQLAENPDLFSIPGEDTSPAGFGETWMRTARKLPGAGGP
ncbi:hypothetical protein [Streptomyces sp. 1222.5]